MPDLVISRFFLVFFFVEGSQENYIWHAESLLCSFNFLSPDILLVFVFMVYKNSLTFFLLLASYMNITCCLCCFVFLEVVQTSLISIFVHLTTIWSKGNKFETFGTKHRVAKSSHLPAKINIYFMVSADYFVGLFLWIFRKKDGEISQLLQQ